MSAPFPTVQVLVAFQNNATDDPGLITTVASPPGSLGANNVWTDISRYVKSIQTMTRGRQEDLRQFEAGELSLVLDNNDGRFTPWNTSSPYTGFVDIRKPVQVRFITATTTYKAWTGNVDSWPTDWAAEFLSESAMHASDAFRILNLANITNSGYPIQVKADGATGYWRLADLPGSNQAADSSGNGYTLSLSGDPGVFGTAVTFGKTGAFPSDPATSAQFAFSGGLDAAVSNQTVVVVPNTATAASVEFWFNGNGASSGDPIIPNTTGAGANFVLSGTDYGITAEVLGPTSPGVRAFSGSTLASVSTNLFDGNWHHIVGTMSLSTGVALYVDGALVASNASLPVSTLVPSGISIFSGTQSPGALMQEVAIYPTALTSGQVSNHFTLSTFPQQSTDARIGRVLNTVGWSTGARALDTGYSTVQQVTSTLTTTASLSHMQDVEATETGALFMTGDGKVKFLSRQTLFGNTNSNGALYTTNQATFGDNTAGGDMPYDVSTTPQIAKDDIDLYNEATAARAGGVTQVWSNAASIATYGRVTWQPPASLLGISDSEVLYLCQYVVDKYNTPTERIRAITVNMATLVNLGLADTFFGLDLLYRVTVERTIMPAGGTAFSQACNIERFQHQITPNQWTVTIGLAKADNAFWILGTSQLGTGTRLAF